MQKTVQDDSKLQPNHSKVYHETEIESSRNTARFVSAWTFEFSMANLTWWSCSKHVVYLLCLCYFNCIETKNKSEITITFNTGTNIAYLVAL